MDLNYIAPTKEATANTRAGKFTALFDEPESLNTPPGTPQSFAAETNSTVQPTEFTSSQVHLKNELKIVIAGNVGSGKSTSIRAISEIPVVATESKATESDALRRKVTTTTAIDYGIARIADTKLHLYGTPGQRRFDFM